MRARERTSTPSSAVLWFAHRCERILRDSNQTELLRPEKEMPPIPSYISASIKISGTISAEEDVYIDGEVKGSLCAPAHCVTVGELAYVNAETVAREVVVYGAVQGGLCGYDKIEIKKRASVAGDLATARIIIEPGAHFKGVISTA